MNLSEHIASLFVAGVYYWCIGQDDKAELCFRHAHFVIELHPPIIGET